MVYKKFRIVVFFRVLLLAATLFSLFWLIFYKEYQVLPILIGVFALIQIFGLINYVEKTNRDLSNFLEAIRYSDFSRSFQVEGIGKSFDRLKESFNRVMEDFQKIRNEKEEHYYYLKNIIEHIGISIIAYQKDGTVEMVNKTAKNLFQIKRLRNIKELNSWNEELVKTLNKIGNDKNTLIKVQDHDDILQLSIYSKVFVLSEREITLVSIKNIQAELEEQEMEAWQKLIRVLTHEIMNSIAPISSLTSTVNLMVKDIATTINEKNYDNIDIDSIYDIKQALQTIHKRSNGLIHFVETYRNLTKIPKPNFNIFPIEHIFKNIHLLMAEELKKHNISCQINILDKNMELTADEQLVEQVVINLLRNSMNAIEGKENGQIELKAYINKRDKKIIQVIDNGSGILKEVIDKIFIPFFTTKKTGSGIGLSLSKQILRLHGGTISVQSEPDKETCFTLTFP